MARIFATNSIGTSIASPLNTSGATVANLPAKMIIPFKGGLTTDSQIDVQFTPLTTTLQTGNSAILSYELAWDNGNGAGAVSVIVQNSLATSALLQGLNGGQDYYFKVRARNIYGFGDFSNVAKIRASYIPDTPDIINTISLLTNIIISWSPPPNGGDNITKYQLLIYVPNTASFVEDLTYCDGSTQTNFDNASCTVPQAYLISTYGFIVGELLQAKVRAYNINGWGAFSQLNVAGAYIQSVPA